ncbi:hypothetical protein [Actinoplanes sp. NPDC049316]|uniref:hypothetical protein n=1 Tax=Actinoplanes sp. NPDC049316 TaxID=3154727 RepID=UPI003447B4D8
MSRHSKRALLGGSATAALLIALIAAPNAARAANHSGTLDESFGGDGIVVTDIGGTDAYDAIQAVVATPGGRILAAGLSNPLESAGATALARYRWDGSLDPGFGTQGQETLSFADVAHAAVVQPDGLVVVGGSKFNDYGALPDFALARLLPDGSLDPAFGQDGQVTTDFGEHDELLALARQPDGKLVAAGYTYKFLDTTNMALARYLPNGSLDTRFGQGGKVVMSLLPTASASAVVVQPDGRIVVAGWTGGADFVLARFRRDGSLDRSFGTGGLVTTDLGEDSRDQAAAMTLHGDGLVVVGQGLGGAAVARYRMNGSLDPNFGTGGVLRVPGLTDAATAVVTYGSDLIVGTARFSLARLDRHGALRTDFGTGGVLTTKIGGSASLQALAWQPDGRLVAAGYTSDAPHWTDDFAVARYRIN